MTSKTQKTPKKEQKRRSLTTLEEKAPGVFLLTMNTPTFNNQLVSEINTHLDTIEATTGPAALITTSSIPKVYSKGVDFPVFDLPDQQLRNFIKAFTKMLGRITTVGFPTIAAINGHCFAGGTLFCMSHDFRVMRQDYGILCLPEIDIGSSFAPVQVRTCKAKVDYQAMRRLAVFGEKIFPKTGLKLKILDKIVPQEELIEYCVGLGAALGTKAVHRGALKEIKMVLYREVYEASSGYPIGGEKEFYYFRDNKKRILKELGIAP